MLYFNLIVELGYTVEPPSYASTVLSFDHVVEIGFKYFNHLVEILVCRVQ